MRLRNSSFLVILLAGLAGCSATADTGTTGSGIWGSSFGAGTASIAKNEASAAIALLQDNEFGQSLEASDRNAAVEAQRRALRARGVGVAVAWENAKTGRSGQVRPGPIYQVNKMTCREFTHEMVINGSVVTARGTACKEPDGAWKTLS